MNIPRYIKFYRIFGFALKSFLLLVIIYIYLYVFQSIKKFLKIQPNIRFWRTKLSANVAVYRDIKSARNTKGQNSSYLTNKLAHWSKTTIFFAKRNRNRDLLHFLHITQNVWVCVTKLLKIKTANQTFPHKSLIVENKLFVGSYVSIFSSGGLKHI